jgi:hypothetical protein
MKLLIILAVLNVGTLAMAEGHEATQMNFNAMIDANSATAAGLNKELKDQYKTGNKHAAKTGAKEDKAVDDFITYEVHHLKKDKVAADEKPKAKRVYNSVN